MHDDAQAVQSYEPPSIEERAPIDVPLIGVGGSAVGGGSAAFRAVPGEPYEPPSIEERTPVDLPLVQAAGSQPTSAAFRPELSERYEPPRIEERTEIDLPLIGSQSPCAVFCSVFTKP